MIISLARKRSSLALGNVIGSAISNILGAFSLGLLFVKPSQADEQTLFDRSSKVYALVQLVFTLISALFLVFKNSINYVVAGSVLILGFAGYVLSIAWYIRKGLLNAPELSDSDSDNDSDSDESGNGSDDDSSVDNERTPLNTNSRTRVQAYGTSLPAIRKRKSRGLCYHIAMVLIGFSAIVLSSFVLSYAATGIADIFGLSDTLVGIVILSIATTLPEKFIAVMSGSRGHMNIMMANTVGSNIFLLGLCLGVILVGTGGHTNQGFVSNAEILVMVASTCAMTATVWLGARFARLVGLLMLVGYLAFCTVELVKGV